MLKVAFLDRDGTINVDLGYVHRWDQWTFLDGAVGALLRLRAAGFRMAVVSNQSGIGRGLFTSAAVHQLHFEMQQYLAARGAAVDAIAICPHAPDQGCDCRKPRVGLATQIARSLGQPIDFSQSWMIGDKPTDVEFGRRLGARCGLIRSRYWSGDALPVAPELVGDSLDEISQAIVAANWQH